MQSIFNDTSSRFTETSDNQHIVDNFRGAHDCADYGQGVANDIDNEFTLLNELRSEFKIIAEDIEEKIMMGQPVTGAVRIGVLAEEFAVRLETLNAHVQDLKTYVDAAPAIVQQHKLASSQAFNKQVTAITEKYSTFVNVCAQAAVVLSTMQGLHKNSMHFSLDNPANKPGARTPKFGK